MIYFSVIQFLVGIFLLYHASNYLIDHGSLLAKKYNVSKIFIGMTLLAFGTSLPELIVSLVASYRGEIDLVVGNVLGSNIANIGLVFGICGLLYSIKCKIKEINLDILLMFLSTLVFSVLLYLKYFNVSSGMLLLIIFTIYIYISYAFKSNELISVLDLEKNNDKTGNYAEAANKKSMLFIVLGVLGLSLGSNILVESAINIAKYFNISSMIIGITAVAIGTSLPELATSLNAVKKKEFSLFLGNILGSNIINIIFVFGISLLINPNYPLVEDYTFQILILLIMTSLFIISIIYISILRLTSIILLIIYTYFMIAIFF